MGTPAFASLSQIVSPYKAGSILTPARLQRRAKRRRQILGMIGLAYIIDAYLLLAYAFAGTIPTVVAPVFAGSGLALVFGYIFLSELGFHDRFSDHYLSAPFAIIHSGLQLTFAYFVPEAGVLFLCAFFAIFSFSSLRSNPRQTAMIWTAMAVGLAWLFLFTDKPIAIPHDGYLERFATMAVFLLTAACSMFLGIFSSSLQQSLYASTLRLKEAYKRIEELAELDELTGSLNRRSIMQVLQHEINRSRFDKNPCAVALLDLDWFKQINDTHGHLIGDEVLKIFATTMMVNIRDVDRFGRFGGEEFLLILPQTSVASGAKMVERLRVIVSSLDLSAFAPALRITNSAGVATIQPNETVEAVLARADSALYSAKAQGRNRIVCA